MEQKINEENIENNLLFCIDPSPLCIINDIVEDIESGINLFADDTSLSLVVRNPSDAGMILQDDINKINNWAESWLCQISPSKIGIACHFTKNF